MSAYTQAMKLLVTVLISTLAMFAADLAGTWKGSMNTQQGEAEITVTIKPGGQLTGTVQAGEYISELHDAKASGDKVSFEMRIGPGVVRYEGTVNGNEIKFDVTGTQGDKYVLICKRQ